MKNKVIIKGDIAEIHIHSKTYGDFITIVDAEDIPRIMEAFTTICLNVQKSKNKILYYAYGQNRGNRTLLHRFIMNCPEEYVIDHYNNNGLFNLKENLRICTQGENMLNSETRGKYPRGISFHKPLSKFKVSITLEKGKQKHVGYYKTLAEATVIAEKMYSERGGYYIQ